MATVGADADTADTGATTGSTGAVWKYLIFLEILFTTIRSTLTVVFWHCTLLDLQLLDEGVRGEQSRLI